MHLLGVCLCVSESPCGLWGSRPSVWFCSAVPEELCYFREILSGTLANDPIRTCITSELTGDYTPRRTAEERATLSDTARRPTGTHLRRRRELVEIRCSIGSGVCFPNFPGDWHVFRHVFWWCNWTLGVIYVAVAFVHLSLPGLCRAGGQDHKWRFQLADLGTWDQTLFTVSL